MTQRVIDRLEMIQVQRQANQVIPASRTVLNNVSR